MSFSIICKLAIVFASVEFATCKFLYSNLIKEVENDIIKAPDDKRSFRAVKLINDMKVLFVQNPHEEQVAIDLDVRAGYMNDPRNLPGLAQFLAKNTFSTARTQKYPRPGELLNFIGNNDGYGIGHADADHSRFFISVPFEKLSGSLDRFAQLFISPQFSLEMIKKPKNDEQDDSDDFEQWPYFLRSMANKSHPFYIPPKEKIEHILMNMVKTKSPALLKELVKFYEQYYSSNLMSLVVAANRSIDDMMDIVVPLFSHIPNKNLRAPYWPVHPYGPNQTGYLFEIEVRKEREGSFRMFFPCPDYSRYFRSKPWVYVTHLLSHYNSPLVKILKRKGLANFLLTFMNRPANGFAFIDIHGFLTKKGAKNVEDVIETIIQYLAYLNTEPIRKWIFKEAQEQMQKDLRTDENIVDMKFTRNPRASMLHYVPAKFWVNEKFIMDEYKPDLIKNFLSHLSADNFNFYLSIKSLKGKPGVQQGWFNMKYRMEKLNDNLIKRLRSPNKQNFPKPNFYLPENFDILKPDDSEKSTVPILIHDSALSRVWYLKDQIYLAPKVYLYFYLRYPLATSSPLNAALCSVFSNMIVEAVKPETLDGDFGLIQTVSTSMRASGLVIKIVGYNDKLHDFVISVFELMTSLELYLNQFMKMKKENPYEDQDDNRQSAKLAQYYSQLLLKSKITKWKKVDILNAIKRITLKQMENFKMEFFSKLHVELFAYGNIKRAGALKILNSVMKTIKKRYVTSPLILTDAENLRTVELLEGKTFLYKTAADDVQKSAVHLTFQSSIKNIKSAAMNALIQNIFTISSGDVQGIDKRFKGFSATCSSTQDKGFNSIEISMEGDKTPELLHADIESFLRSIEQNITIYITMWTGEGEKFESYKNWFIGLSKYKNPNTMEQMSLRYWPEILNESYFFKRKDMIADAMRKITRDEITSYFKDMLNASSPKRRKLVVYLYSSKDKQATSSNNKDMVTITSIPAFKSALSFYELPKPYVNVPQIG